MTSAIEKRRHPRIPVKWPVVLNTPQGSITGETVNISVGGALIFYSEKPELSDDFRIVLNASEEHALSITCEKIWSRNFNIDGKTVFMGMGVRFTDISVDDRQFISSLVADHRK